MSRGAAGGETDEAGPREGVPLAAGAAPAAERPETAAAAGERTYRLQVCYDGSAYHGWQVQPELPTVQGEIERALARIAGQAVRVQGAGRTDAGVHALGQVASFRTAARVPEARLRPALNAHLPRDIRVLAAGRAPDRFAARFSAVWRRYRYLIAPVETPFLRGRAWVPRSWPDRERMNAAAAALPGEHDCAAFTTQPEGPYACVIHEARWEEWEGGLAFLIRSDRFLYQMVRIVVGTCLEIGRGRLPPEALKQILAGRDRRRAGPLAPACGLYLLAVGYQPPWPGEENGLPPGPAVPPGPEGLVPSPPAV